MINHFIWCQSCFEMFVENRERRWVSLKRTTIRSSEFNQGNGFRRRQPVGHKRMYLLRYLSNSFETKKMQKHQNFVLFCFEGQNHKTCLSFSFYYLSSFFPSKSQHVSDFFMSNLTFSHALLLWTFENPFVTSLMMNDKKGPWRMWCGSWFFFFTKKELTDSVDRVSATNKLYSLIFLFNRKKTMFVFIFWMVRIGGDLTTLREHGNSCWAVW
jgi:hypothetical protein